MPDQNELSFDDQIAESEEQLSQFSLSETYMDGLTGFSGRCTSKISSLAESPQILLENDTSSRWLPISRVVDLTGQRVIEQTENVSSIAAH